MRILLTNSPAYIKDMNRHFSYGRFGCTMRIPYSLGGKNATKVKDHYTPYPWSLGYASAILKRDTKETIKAIDAQARDYNEEDFIKAVKDFKPGLMVVELPTISFSLCMDILRELKKKSKFTLIITGLHASGLPVEVMKKYSFIDYVIKGDYGLPLLKFIETNGSVNKVYNLYYRKGRAIKKSKAKMEFVNFDSLPYPDREDLPCEHYHDFEIAGKPTIHIVTSRSCPFMCSYCNVRVFWPSGFYWKRSVKNIVDEMEYVKEKHGAKQIYFDDDIMTFDRERMVDFANEILKRKLKIPWAFMGSIHIDEKLMKLLVKAGAIGLKFGVESTNPETLKNINKAWVSEEKVRKFVKMCKKYGVYTHGDFIVGLPQDNKESLERTLKLMIDLDLDSAQIYTAQPLPGTPFYYQAKKNGWLVAKDWTEYDGSFSSPVSYPWLKKEEIEAISIKMQKEWTFSAFKNYFKSPSRAFRYLKGKGFFYTIKKVKVLLKKRNQDHVFVPGT